MLDTFVSFMLGVTADLGYLGVFGLMAIESSFIPFPSEVVVPPAAYLAAKGEMNLALVVVSGLFGSLIGALVNYYLALYLGKPTVDKLLSKSWAKFLLLDKKKLDKAEKYFVQHGAISTFVGRLIPGIRQLISLPAGFSRMNVAKFAFFTSLGAGIWVLVLALLGYYFGENEELFALYYHEITLGALIFVGVVVSSYVLWVKKFR